MRALGKNSTLAGTTHLMLQSSLHPTGRTDAGPMGDASQDADRQLPGLAEHLQGCPACREDHVRLREFVRLQDG